MLLNVSPIGQGIKKTIHPHQLRHSYATHMVDNGAPLEVIQSLLGHEKSETTKIYAHLSGKLRHDFYSKYFYIFSTAGYTLWRIVSSPKHARCAHFIIAIHSTFHFLERACFHMRRSRPVPGNELPEKKGNTHESRCES